MVRAPAVRVAFHVQRAAVVVAAGQLGEGLIVSLHVELRSEACTPHVAQSCEPTNVFGRGRDLVVQARHRLLEVALRPFMRPAFEFLICSDSTVESRRAQDLHE